MRLVTITLTEEELEALRTTLRGAISVYTERPTQWPGEPEGYERAVEGIRELLERLPPAPAGPSTVASCPRDFEFVRSRL